jgi:hypothetical protein
METEQQFDREMTRRAALGGPKKSHKKFITLLVVLGILLIASIAAGVLSRRTHDLALASTADN